MIAFIPTNKRFGLVFPKWGKDMQFHIFGDSHAAYCFDRVENASVNWLGPMTMHRASLEADNFVAPRVVDATVSDVLVMVFGEIDVRCHLLKIAEKNGTTVDQEATTLAGRYATAVKRVQRKIGFQKAVIVQPPYPANTRPNPELPFIGPLKCRVDAHRSLSRALATEAENMDLYFLRIPDQYANPDGTLRRKFSDDGVHIMPIEAKQIAIGLSRLVKEEVTFKPSPIDIFRRRWNYLFNGPLRTRGMPVPRNS